MNLKNFLSAERDKLKPNKEDIDIIQKQVKEIISFLKQELKRIRAKASVDLGGSYAKGTMVKKDSYEVDILLRFDKDDGKLSELTEPLVKKLAKQRKARCERVHGSRDYFRVYFDKLVIEVIPVLKIRKPSQEKNVTDLSYFHVSYVKKKAKKLAEDIRLAKTFCKAQGVYGAESYINGFSGYTLECLIIYYKGFIPFLKALAHVEEQIIVDPAKHYKNANLVRISLNESKSRSPIILVDPTYKERNALAALSYETFFRFQQAAQAFLKSPRETFFIEKPFDKSVFEKEAVKKKAEFVELEIETDRQEGDIAGTKMKKFFSFMIEQLRPTFTMINEHFVYKEGQTACIYLVLASKKEIIRKGPTLAMEEYAKAFKKAHQNTFVKNKMLYARIPLTLSARTYIDEFAKKPILKEMGITNLRILSR